MKSLFLNASHGKSVKYKEHQTGTTIKSRDKPRKALLPGKRISKTGKEYWEYRKNRSDLLGETI